MSEISDTVSAEGGVFMTMDQRKIDRISDGMTILYLAGRLDFSPKKNWVENSGGLPKYIEDIAIALIRDQGYTRERAIATAISRIRAWIADPKTSPAVKAKASAALAEWEALKAKNSGKKAVKGVAKKA